jgi:hypothetical protein
MKSKEACPEVPPYVAAAPRVEPDTAAIQPDARLTVEHRPARCELDRDNDEEHQRRCDHQQERGNDNVDDTLDPLVTRESRDRKWWRRCRRHFIRQADGHVHRLRERSRRGFTLRGGTCFKRLHESCLSFSVRLRRPTIHGWLPSVQ